MKIIVADAGPLIIFAVTGKFHIINALFQQIIISQTVLDELAIAENLPGAKELNRQIDDGFIKIEKVANLKPSTLFLDLGEAEAITLASDKKLLLLIDEKRGRIVAKKEKLKFFGSGRILIVAKEKKIIKSATDVMNQFIESGYRISDELYKKIKKLSNE